MLIITMKISLIGMGRGDDEGDGEDINFIKVVAKKNEKVCSSKTVKSSSSVTSKMSQASIQKAFALVMKTV